MMGWKVTIERTTSEVALIAAPTEQAAREFMTKALGAHGKIVEVSEGNLIENSDIADYLISVQSGGAMVLRARGDALGGEAAAKVQADLAPVARNNQDDGRAAIRIILAQPYLPLDGAEATVADWLVAAKVNNEASTGPHNKVLSGAGLGVCSSGDLIIAAPGVFPTLTVWLADTSFNSRKLLYALASLPGAARVNLRFAGITVKAVRLPWALAEEAMR